MFASLHQLTLTAVNHAWLNRTEVNVFGLLL